MPKRDTQADVVLCSVGISPGLGTVAECILLDEAVLPLKRQRPRAVG